MAPGALEVPGVLERVVALLTWADKCRVKGVARAWRAAGGEALGREEAPLLLGGHVP